MEPQPGDRAQHCEGWLRDPLGMLQVAGRVVRHVEVEGARRTGAPPGQQLGHVQDSRPERPPSLGSEQVPVVLEEGATPRTVHRDEIALSVEGADIRFREPDGTGAISGVLMQGAAASLPGHLAHSIPVRSQGASGRVMDMSEQRVHHAAAEQRDGRSGGAAPGRVPSGCAVGNPGRPGGRQHRHAEPDLSGPAQEVGYPKVAQLPGSAEHDTPPPGVPKHGQNQPGNRTNAALARQQFARRLEAAAVFNA